MPRVSGLSGLMGIFGGAFRGMHRGLWPRIFRFQSQRFSPLFLSAVPLGSGLTVCFVVAFFGGTPDGQGLAETHAISDGCKLNTRHIPQWLVLGALALFNANYIRRFCGFRLEFAGGPATILCSVSLRGRIHDI